MSSSQYERMGELDKHEITENKVRQQQEVIIESNGYIYFSNGKHTHNLKYLPQIFKFNDHQPQSYLVKKEKDLIKLPQLIFKKWKSNNMEKSIPLIDSAELFDDNSKTTDVHIQSEIGSSIFDKVPKAVNSNSCIDKKQLDLIQKLSGRMSQSIKYNIKDPMWMVSFKEDPKQVPRNFKNRYGNLVDDINVGSFGRIKVTVKKKTNKVDIRNSKYTFTDNSNLFFAIKEFKQKDPGTTINKYNTHIISEFIIGNSFFGKCPNLLNIFTLMETQPGKYFQVMEFCPSVDLHTYIKEYTKMDKLIHVTEADCFMKQLLNGVAFMHNHGVAHCDIKLENILSYPNGLLKLCDFGNSSVFQTAWELHIHKQKENVGTQPYIAPETYGRRFYDPRVSDAWSCGVVYMTMVLGRYMWKQAETSEDLLYQQFRNEIITTNKFYIFEELTHIYPRSQLLRKRALYRIFECDPTKRINVTELLQDEWISKVYCCQE